MRRFLVKNFVGYCMSKIMGVSITPPKVANWIASILILLWVSFQLDLGFVVDFILYAMLGTLVFISFIYFRIWPADLDELDRWQKYKAYYAPTLWMHEGHLTHEQYLDMKLEYDDARWLNWFPPLMPLILLIIGILIFLNQMQ